MKLPWIGRRNANADVPDIGAAPAPDRLTFAVGDIHGRFDKLQQLFDVMCANGAAESCNIVFLGDYVDRGPDSASVIRWLMKLCDNRPDDVVCLLGNHERMLLNFMETPADVGRRWLTAGGQDTLASFGVDLAKGTTLAEKLQSTSEHLEAALGAEAVQWLRSRPTWWRSGNLVAVHAQTDPELPIDRQLEGVLLWGRPPRSQRPRSDACWVVHGHTVVDAPKTENGHIAIDTGAWRGGPLTAAMFDGAAPRFLTDC